MSGDAYALPFLSTDLIGAAEYTKVSIREIQLAVKNNDLVAHYLGKKPVFTATELLAWVESLPTEPHRRTP